MAGQDKKKRILRVKKVTNGKAQKDFFLEIISLQIIADIDFQMVFNCCLS